MIFNEVPTPHNRERTISSTNVEKTRNHHAKKKKKNEVGLYSLSSPPTKINPKWIKYPNIKLLQQMKCFVSLDLALLS